MNKIIVKEQIDIEKDGTYSIELNDQIKTINIKENTNSEILFYGKNINQEIKINIDNNASLFCQGLFEDISSVFEIHLNDYNAKIDFVYSMLTKNETNSKFIVYHQGKNTSSSFINHIVNYGDKMATIQVDAYVPKNINDCKLNQDNKIIILGNGKGKILPNLFIDEYTTDAKHSAYISKFSKEEIFYLKSRGINDENANFLLTKSFLLGKMKLTSVFLQMFTEIIQNFRG